jgi:3-oxoacyl-[acyl-carrier-protein] synthase I
MSAQPIAIQRTGLVTSVGLTAEQSCAAIRAKISNPTETRFIDSGGEWIMAHQVPLEKPWRGRTKLAKMAAMAIEEAMADVPKGEWAKVPLLLCVAEQERPGRMEGLDGQLFLDVQNELDARFAAESAVVPQGRVSVVIALMQARSLIHEAKSQQVLIAATDSLLNWPTLSHFERQDRLLTSRNSNGFMPGEGAGALLMRAATGRSGELLCTGIGFGREAAHIESEKPLRAEGLTHAMKTALAEAGRQVQEMDFRITDNSGEQYYFKEASLAVSRILRVHKEELDIWHPAECTGEVGAATGAAILAAAKVACEKNYSKGPNFLAHMANDAGQRAAMSLQYRST